jgi:predicted O-methyltransferase YrrM
MNRSNISTFVDTLSEWERHEADGPRPQLDRSELRWISKIERLRTDVEHSERQVLTIDYGAGSKEENRSQPQSSPRLLCDSVGAICRQRSMDQHRATALFWATRALRPNNVLELGTCLGISTAYISAALKLNGTGSVTSIEGCPALATIARDNLKSLGLNQTPVVEGRFVDVLPRILPAVGPFDCAFIDGHHDGSATEQYFDQIMRHCDRDAVVLLDDVDWSSDMRKAWRAIQRRSTVLQSAQLTSLGVIIKGKAGPLRARVRRSLSSILRGISRRLGEWRLVYPFD